MPSSFNFTNAATIPSCARPRSIGSRCRFLGWGTDASSSPSRKLQHPDNCHITLWPLTTVTSLIIFRPRKSALIGPVAGRINDPMRRVPHRSLVLRCFRYLKIERLGKMFLVWQFPERDSILVAQCLEYGSRECAALPLRVRLPGTTEEPRRNTFSHRVDAPCSLVHLNH